MQVRFIVQIVELTTLALLPSPIQHRVDDQFTLIRLPSSYPSIPKRLVRNALLSTMVFWVTEFWDEGSYRFPYRCADYVLAFGTSIHSSIGTDIFV
jgi:hypothetical protein